MSTEVEGVIEGADLSRYPPLLQMGGLSFTIDKIRGILPPEPQQPTHSAGHRCGLSAKGLFFQSDPTELALLA